MSSRCPAQHGDEPTTAVAAVTATAVTATEKARASSAPATAAPAVKRAVGPAPRPPPGAWSVPSKPPPPRRRAHPGARGCRREAVVGPRIPPLSARTCTAGHHLNWDIVRLETRCRLLCRRRCRRSWKTTCTTVYRRVAGVCPATLQSLPAYFTV